METLKLNQELSRCLGCKLKPCEIACPLHVSPQEFIAFAKAGDFTTAASNIAKKNPLPQTCGLICPDYLCQKACIRSRVDTPIEIPCLQAEIMRRGGYPELTIPPSIHKKAAIIGSGPAGLGALFELLLAGWSIDLYDQSSFLGGATRLIPEYRLPKSILDYEINRLITNNRVELFLNKQITDFEKLKAHYDGVILALGETFHRTLGIKGDEYGIPYTEYLSHPEQYKGKKIAVSGGGEVALDCALTAKRQGFEKVEMFVRRRREDMRIMAKDQLELERFGIIVHDLSSITEISKSPQNLTLNTIKNCLDADGKAKAIKGTEKSFAGYDFVVHALGSYFPQDDIPADFLLAGDMIEHKGTVVQAIASGRISAKKLINGETL